MLRARPSGEVPSMHAVEIDASFPGASQLPLVAGASEPGGQPGATNRPLVKIEIRTDPPGALVYVDHVLYTEKTKTPKTPCAVSVAEGKHAIRLKQQDYLDGVFDNLDCREGQVLTWAFRKDTSVQDTVVKVSAITGWKASGVKVAAGDPLTISVSGTWSCGSRGEKVDAGGYPVDKRFFFYYMETSRSPRITPDAPYGALLMRIGPPGSEIIPVTGAMRMTARTSGALYFNINEAEDSEVRRDNIGVLQVRVRRPSGTR
jgi:hypothetical protein